MTTDQGIMECQLPFLDQVWAEQELEWGSGIWASAHNALRTTVLDAVHQTFATDTCLSKVKLMYDTAFKAEDPLKFHCFKSLHNLLDSELLPAAVSQALASCKPVLTDIMTWFNLNHDGAQPLQPTLPQGDAIRRLHRIGWLYAWLLHAADSGTSGFLS